MKLLVLLGHLVVCVLCRPQGGGNVESRNKVTLLPFYGGGKGQYLQVTETEDGKVVTEIVTNPNFENISTTEETVNPDDLEYPPLPSKHDLEYNSNLSQIQRAASKILELEENVKETGILSKEAVLNYNKESYILESAIDNGSQLQYPNVFLKNGDTLIEWFEKKRNKTRNEEIKKQEKELSKQETEKKKNEENKIQEEIMKEENRKNFEESVKEEIEKYKVDKIDNEKGNGDEDDTVSINVPPNDSSVAEAKPVGLAIAGEGGIAASKPIATAVVGPGGLAVARPVGTAIAGTSPDKAMIPENLTTLLSTAKPPKRGSSDYLSKIIKRYHNV